MSLLRKGELVGLYNGRQATLLDEGGEKRWAGGRLVESSKQFSYANTYDIFLSHSYDDARIVKLIKEMLEERGFTVYVDWIDDANLDRGKVTAQTASILRGRMNRCMSLIYLTSLSAESSLWMPWELGYMDARTSKVAVAPILEEDENFEGREYLGLYPYVDLTIETFYIHRNTNEWVNLKGWMEGQQPKASTL